MRCGLMSVAMTGGLDGGVPNSVFNKKIRAYSGFDK